MSNNDKRYRQLDRNADIYILGDAPLVLLGKALTYDNKNDVVLGQLKFQSISEKTIIAIKIAVNGFDVSKQQIEQLEHQYLDLKMQENDTIGSQTPIHFNDKNVRNYIFEVKQIIFSDNETFVPSDHESVRIEKKLIGDILSYDLAEQYKRDLNCQTIAECGDFVPLVYKNGIWRCTCGAINSKHRKKCFKCGCDFSREKELLNEDTLKTQLEQYKIDVETAKKKKQEENQALKKLIIKIVAGTIAFIAIIVCGNKIYNNLIVPHNQYKMAQELVDSKKYDDAIEIYEELGNYKDAKEKVNKTKELKQNQLKEENYNKAIKLYQSGEFDDARTMFQKEESYKDTTYYIGRCMLEQGSYEDAKVYLEKVDSKSEFLKESKEAIKQCNYEIGKQNMKNGNIFTAKECFEQAEDYEKTTDLLSLVQEEIDKGFVGIFQRTDDEKEYLEILCLINPDTKAISYEAYFQDSVVENSYIGGVIQDDGSLLLIDTYDNTLTTTEYDEQIVTHSTHQFQPDISVYSSSGTKGFGGSSVKGRKISLSISDTGIIESYNTKGTSWLRKEDFDNSGTYEYKRISDTK